MKKILFFSVYTLCLTWFGVVAYAQPNNPSSSQPNIFVIQHLDDNSLLVSLSDIYEYNENDVIIPVDKKRGLVKLQYRIEGAYRADFLKKAGLSETDTLYSYHYPSGQTVALPVKDLHVVAHLNDYSSLDEAPFSGNDYMLGFDIPADALLAFNQNIDSNYVYIGQDNPFSQEPMTALSWQKIDAASFPVTTKAQDEKVFADRPTRINLAIGNTYVSKANGLTYYLQDRIEDSQEVSGRRLLVVESKNQQVIFDSFFYESEGVSLAMLNSQSEDNYAYQWTGKLFKDKPPVVFGFTWLSFGCRGIWVTYSNDYVPTYCDSRH